MIQESETLNLPQSTEAERAVLGSILADNFALAIAGSILKESDFFLDSHRRIFHAIEALAEKPSAIDLITLKTELARTNGIEKAGGLAYVASLLDGIPDILNVEHYARIIKDKAILRRLLELGTLLTREAASGGKDAADVLGDASSRMFDIAQDSVRGGFAELHAIAEHNLEVLEEARNRQGSLTGIGSGFTELDRLTSGFQKSDLIIVAARPSVGKTSFALNIAQHVAIHDMKCVAFFSLEMSKEALGLRVLCSEAAVDSQKVRRGFGSNQDFQQLVGAQTQMAGKRFFIDDSALLTVPLMRAKCQRLQREHGLDMVVVDYLQLMAGHGRVENRTQEVSQISRGLKLLAKDLQVPVIALSQLSRQSERRENKEPQLADLRDSGSIEQDADVVIFLYREEMYEKDAAEVKNLASINVAKQRNGPTDEFKLVFLKEFTTFHNYAHVAEPGF